VPRRPNIVFIFADEWRAQATGYAGDANCETPNLDALAEESLSFPNAVAGCPVCCPYRASLMTGQYPLTHGVYINDVELNPGAHSIARAFGAGGWQTAYIGKWHLYGSPDGKCGRRKAYVPRDRQLGFDLWMGFECCHDYNHSPYFVNDDPTPRMWEGYDAFAQSRAAGEYIRAHAQDEQPYMLMLSWGPPHFPDHTAPEAYRARYRDRGLVLRPNVPANCRDRAVDSLSGYYAHIAALDDCLALVREAVRESGAEEDTIVVFTADHGDMMLSQGLIWKQFAFDESIRVPFLLRYPRLLGDGARTCPVPIDAPDIMPTLLGLCGQPVPKSVEGTDWSPLIRGEAQPSGNEAALLTMPAVYTTIQQVGMSPYRGLRTARYTYVRDTEGPRFLFDNAIDPYQMCDLIGRPAQATLQARLEAQLQARLDMLGDEFLPGEAYLERDGLTHYREVNTPVKEPWTSPWEGDRPQSPGGC
jgi:arylsulfatase A-like enzyme